MSQNIVRIFIGAPAVLAALLVCIGTNNNNSDAIFLVLGFLPLMMSFIGEKILKKNILSSAYNFFITLTFLSLLWALVFPEVVYDLPTLPMLVAFFFGFLAFISLCISLVINLFSKEKSKMNFF